MWRCVAVGFVVVAGACGTAPRVETPDAPSPAGPRRAVRAPERVGPFAVTDSVTYPRPELGTLYRYDGSGAVRPDVYIYPRGADVTVESQAAGFPQALEYWRRRGRYTDFRILSDRPWSPLPDVSGREVIGELLIRQVRHDTYFYVFSIDSTFVKVRITTGRGEAGPDEVRAFVTALMEAIDRQARRPHTDPRGI